MDSFFLCAGRSLLLLSALFTLVACQPQVESKPEPEILGEWHHLAAPADLPPEKDLIAGFLVVDGVFNSEWIAPYDILHHVRFREEKPGLEVISISPDGSAVTTFEGLRVEVDYSFDDHPPIDILVVPSSDGSMDRDLKNERLMAWVRETGNKARYLVSICDGAFVLAEAGLLDGRKATTFPGDQKEFAERYPKIELITGASVVIDGKAFTGVGGARSYDPAMALVDHIWGESAAKGVAGGMVIDWPPGKNSLSFAVVANNP